LVFVMKVGEVSEIFVVCHFQRDFIKQKRVSPKGKTSCRSSNFCG